MEKEIITSSAIETMKIGHMLGQMLENGMTVLLDGNLGSGKTTLTKGIGQALHIQKTINSPTYTIMKTYEGSKRIYHLDLYRLEGLEHDFDLEEYIFDEQAISIIEWPFHNKTILPLEYLLIKIKTLEEEKRLLTIIACGAIYEKVVEKLCID